MGIRSNSPANGGLSINAQYVAIAVIGIAFVIVALVIFAPGVLPGERDYYGKVKVRIGKEIFQSGAWVNIEDVTFEQKIINLDMMGLRIRPIEGTLKIESFKDAVRIDSTTQTWSLGWIERDKPFYGTVKLGQPGSGEYIIKATIYPEGEATKEDSFTIQVPEE